MRKHVSALAAGMILFVNALATLSQAQEASVSDTKEAIFVLDLDTESFLKGSALDKFTFRALGLDAISFRDIKRIYGAASAPTDLQSLKVVATTMELTFDFFLQVQFNSIELADKAFAKVQNAYEPRMFEGRKLYAIVSDEQSQAPKNLFVHRYSPDTIELGTVSYLRSPNRKLLSKNLAGLGNSKPLGLFRIALDIDGVRPLIDEYRRLKPVQVVVHPSLVIVEGASVCRVQFDPSDKDGTLQLTFTARDDEWKKQINSILDAMGTEYVKRAEAKISPFMRKSGLAKVPEVKTKLIENDVVVTMTTPQIFLNPLSVAFGVQTPPSSIQFDSQSWRDGTDDDSRLGMVESLEANLNAGMTMEEVIEMLGEPIERSKGRFNYSLGKGLNGYEQYRIHFDDDGKVKSFRQVRR